MRIVLAMMAFLVQVVNVYAVYDVNENCREAWVLMTDLKLVRARALLAAESRSNPENYYCHYLNQCCDAFELLIDPTDKSYKAFLASYESRRRIMDGKDLNSPYYLLCLSEMEIQVAFFSVMNGAQVAGVNKGVAAYKDLHRNIEKFPGFEPNRKLDGFFNVAIANLPPFVKWVLSVMSVKVDIRYGFRSLFDHYGSVKGEKGLNSEAALYLILAAKINKTPEMLYDFTRGLDTAVSNRYIYRYLRANIAYWTGKNEEAIGVLRQAGPGDNRLTGILYNYMMGKLQLRRLDPSAESYISGYFGLTRRQEYFREMHYNLALCRLLKGDATGYVKLCSVVRSTGKDLNERDREALYDASLDYSPELNLVKAKLSLDGGYPNACQQALSQFESGHGSALAYKLEYHLLKGRVAANASNDNIAMAEFRKVLELGSGCDYYFAAEAAYRLGDICRKLGQVKLARDYYNRSAKLCRKNYYEYIGDKAAKGLAQLPGN